MLIGISKADIVTIKTQAIVSVIRPDLSLKGSLNRSIFAGAGTKLDDFILDNIISPREGDVFITPAFNLPSENIIFSVIPTWRSDLDIIDKHLLRAIRGTIETARANNITSLAIPLICCGKKGYPLQRGIRLIMQGVAERMGPPLQKVTFVCDKDEAVSIYKKRLHFDL